MTGKELLKKAMKLEEVERPPWVPFVGVHAAHISGIDAATYLKSEELIVKGIKNAVKLYKADGIPVVFDLQLEAEALGCNLVWTESNPPSVVSHPLAEGLNLSELDIPSENDGRIGIVMNAARELVKSEPEIAFYALVTGPFTLALHLSGTDIFMQMLTEPQRVHTLLRFCTDVAKTMCNFYKKAGVDVIAIVDPMTSQIGTEQFVEFVAPYVSEIFEEIRTLEAFSSFFVCGDARHNIEAMCNCRPDNISVDENVPLDYLRDICLANRISFGGNLKLTSTLLMGTPLDCEKDALECLDIGGNRGYILSPGCDLPFYTVKENLIAVSNLVRDKYRQDIVRELSRQEIECEPLDIAKYSSGDKVKIDVITLDSSSCAPCQYMLDAAVRASESFGDKVMIREYKIKSEEGLSKMRQLGLKNIPAICIDGRPVFVSKIPPLGDIKKAIMERLSAKENLLQQISYCIEKGKVDASMAYPPELKGQPGVDELTKMALEAGYSANEILSKAMIPAMGIVGELFKEKKLFVPQVLMSAMAMKSAMKHLKPYFSSGEIKSKGVFIIGTVAGDLHDIGKNLVCMMVEGAGWKVIDLGTDVKTSTFMDAVSKNRGSVLGMSALLTTTMAEMEKSVTAIHKEYPEQKIIVGGAPVNQVFASKIGADFYAPDPQVAIDYMNSLNLVS